MQTTGAMSGLVDQGVNLLQILERDLIATFPLRRGARFAIFVRMLAGPASRRCKVNY